MQFENIIFERMLSSLSRRPPAGIGLCTAGFQPTSCPSSSGAIQLRRHAAKLSCCGLVPSADQFGRPKSQLLVLLVQQLVVLQLPQLQPTAGESVVAAKVPALRAPGAADAAAAAAAAAG